MRKQVGLILMVAGLVVGLGRALAQTPAAHAQQIMDKDRSGEVGPLDFIRWGFESSMAFVLLGAGAWQYRRDLKEGILGTRQYADHLRVIDENMLGVMDRHTEVEAQQTEVLRVMTEALQKIGGHVQWTSPNCPITHTACPFNAKQQQDG